MGRWSDGQLVLFYQFIHCKMVILYFGFKSHWVLLNSLLKFSISSGFKTHWVLLLISLEENIQRPRGGVLVLKFPISSAACRKYYNE